MKRNIFGLDVIYKREDLSKRKLDGEFDKENKTITVDKSLRGDALKQTTLHEEFEAVFYRIAGDQLEISLDAKEAMIDSFATWVTEEYNLTRRRKK